MSLTDPTVKQQLSEMKGLLTEQGSALTQVRAEAAETKRALSSADAQIEALMREVKSLKETTKTSEVVVQRGDYARRWRGVFLAGACIPHGLAIASIKCGDQRYVAASRTFQIFGIVCSMAAAGGDPNNFGSMNEKLFIVLCALIPPAYEFIKACITGSTTMLFYGCAWMLILPPSYLALVKLYSKFSVRKLGVVVTTIFKSFPGILGSMLYISASAMQCIMDSKPDDELDEWGNIKRCQNPSFPTFWVSVFLAMSWGLTYLLPPLLPSERTLSWNDVMKLNLGSRMEGLQFTLFCTYSMEALVIYSLTNDEGGEVNEFLNGLIDTMIINFGILGFIVVYEYVIKPAICKPSSRTDHDDDNDSGDSFNFQENGLNINSL
ncbi:hypothetical protein TL16_g06946 [Triparma laevis f. inornata]|uniref:Uncharacterized protein n=2 Tax=Triparma laevis TaxID=1534972 RepID=A0A9W7FMI0_9STRA|nr:hypothetical protein TL16_g06946 [Triparma laevis f. inornata]GMI14745.1 hypothetical protein TrLO_g4320 [Triparma laevis f. longispina]